MRRIVVDTNVVVSGVLVDEGLPASILDLAANKKILMIVSENILAEYEEVLRRPHFRSPQLVLSKSSPLSARQAPWYGLLAHWPFPAMNPTTASMNVPKLFAQLKLLFVAPCEEASDDPAISAAVFGIGDVGEPIELGRMIGEFAELPTSRVDRNRSSV